MQQIWLFVAGLVASVVNAAAGGGTLISFPALLASGLSPLQANATSAVALQAGLVISVWVYRDRLSAMRDEVKRMLAPCFVGGVLGAVLALLLGARVFARVAPILLAMGAVLLLVQPWITSRLRKPLHQRRELFVPGMFILAVYCGYFGAGGGILYLAALALLLPRPFDELNALKVLAMPASNGVGALTFATIEFVHPTGVVVWNTTPALAAGAFAGGILGVLIARRLPANALRILSGALGLAMAIYIVVK